MSKKLIQDKRKGEKNNPSNLRTQWDKTRDYIGGYTKCGVRRRMRIRSLTMNRWILTDPSVCNCVILNGPNLSTSNLR